jgi:GAF domain-containing protein
VTLVAGQATAEEIFASVAEEVAGLLRADRGTVCRYEPDGTMTVTAYWASEDRSIPVGTRVEFQADSVAALVQQSGRPARIDSYEGRSGPVVELASGLGAAPGSTVGAPILAEGRVWGAILATSTGPQPFAADTESRLLGFAELVATAISNAVARAELNASRARIVAVADESCRRIERDLRFGERVEVAAYYVVSELLTNAVKYARASVVRVAVEQVNETLQLSVRDDGVGGADPASGSGLIGLRDRVEAIGGTIVVESPAGAGTAVLVLLPLQ